MKRALLMTPEAIERRELRVFREAERQNREWLRNEVMPRVEQGLTFDEAFVAAGGTIISTGKVPRG